ncbi:sigma-70 family RNA polymerase sigma factor [Bradymonadaceae bacterium TMQ3]|uniref:Sigma-70 family RNA polymerase sigma factor n=2 Tax=Lujinxingia sediminis TaxID=2480984 RepID=A0ABY0CNP1_9DELT|nr:sigma-70 family RNA polymerase sigma factor [Bradymonadaceae bacterium TMQ3]RVU40983.1 sigma-70 family RNA polymerase sigma factor [Lujinxingia sediminis]TXC67683.1 sigma-70 family RNA polymerase sigma factor [Bradymonadales bacterium TMQ1]
MNSPRSHSMRHHPDGAIAELMRHWERWVGLAARSLQARADAEDAVQQALVRAAEQLHTLDDPDKLEGWFATIVRRQAIDQLRRRSRDAHKRRRLAIEPAPQAYRAPDDLDPTCACGIDALEDLSPAYAEILTRVILNDEAVQDAADALGISDTNASVRLHRARKALRQELLERCGTTSTRECLSCGCA